MRKGVLLEVLQCMDEQSIPYVSWKNNHEITIALRGGSDIDIFVPITVRNKFVGLLRSNGWVRMDNLYIRYPWVCHYYKLTETGKVFHIHAYHKLITGESLAKEYELPWSRFLIENRVRNDLGVWILNRQAQLFIFSVRHLLKGACFSSRTKYEREIESYREEFQQAGNINEISWGNMPVDLSGYLVGSGLIGEKFRTPSLRVAMRFRFEMKVFKRNGFIVSSLISILVFKNRIINKIFIKSKKVFLDGGVVIAVTGGDGSGKTTMLKEVARDLKAFATVKEIHMGRPLPRWLEFLMRLLTFRRSNRGIAVSTAQEGGGAKKIRGATAVIAVLIAVFRLYRARQAMSYARKGFFVMADRWPTKEYGKMDGPVIRKEFANNYVMRILRSVERKSYDVMPSSDVCFVFQVPIAVAIERNAGRDEKEDEQGLINRHKTNVNPEPICIERVVFDNDGDIDPQKRKFREMFWSKVNSLV